MPDRITSREGGGEGKEGTIETEKKKVRKKPKERQTDRDRKTERQRQRDRNRERQKDRQTEIETERENRDRHRETETDRQTESVSVFCRDWLKNKERKLTFYVSVLTTQTGSSPTSAMPLRTLRGNQVGLLHSL